MNVENPRVKREVEVAEEKEVDTVKEEEVAAAMHWSLTHCGLVFNAHSKLSNKNDVNVDVYQ